MKVGDLVKVKISWPFSQERIGTMAIVVDENNPYVSLRFLDGHKRGCNKSHLEVISESR